jgi:ribonuclease VapC
MVIDTSAIVAIARNEPDAAELEVRIADDPVRLISAATVLADAARRAWRRFGKGRHAAALNYGDCFSYALALARGEPLLFKGEDFAKTDVNRSSEALLR